MKQLCGKTFAECTRARPGDRAKSEDGLLNWNRRTRWFTLRRRHWFAAEGLLCAFCLLTAARPLAAQFPPPTNTVPTGQSPLGDLTAVTADAKIWLQDLIKIDTTNPPGNEQAAAKYILGIFQKEGIGAEELPIAPGRSAVVARLRSSAVADPARALLLVAHLDVVGVDRSKWTVDPFAALIKDGYIYGRGSIDDKAMLAINMATLIALKRANAHLNRDVIFLATDDEEGHGEPSIKTL